jgi:hypothetical protein
LYATLSANAAGAVNNRHAVTVITAVNATLKL